MTRLIIIPNINPVLKKEVGSLATPPPIIVESKAKPAKK